MSLKELVNDVDVVRLGADILSSGKALCNECEYINVENIDSSVMSKIVLSVSNNADVMLDFLLYKNGYKTQMESCNLDFVESIITKVFLSDRNRFYYDYHSSKFYLKKIVDKELVNNISVEDVIDYVLDSSQNDEYTCVRRVDQKIDLENEDACNLRDSLIEVGCFDLDGCINTMEFPLDKAKSIVDSYILSKGYIFDEDEVKYYIPVKAEDKASVLKALLDKNNIVYEQCKENLGVFDVNTAKGNVELYLNMYSQYAVDYDAYAYHYSDSEEFILDLKSQGAEIRLDSCRSTQYHLSEIRMMLEENEIRYRDGLYGVLVVDTNAGPMEMYQDTMGNYCIEDIDSNTYCVDNVLECVNKIKRIVGGESVGQEDSQSLVLNVETYYNDSRSWIMHKTIISNNVDEIDSVVTQIFSVKDNMKEITGDIRRELGYDDLDEEIQWTKISNGSTDMSVN